MSDTALSVTGLRKVYRSRTAKDDEIVALDDLTFTVPQGGSVGIVGESGSGKTTTAKLIAGLEEPTAGSISVGGESWGHGRLRSRERRQRGRTLQMVFQNPYSSLDRRQRVNDCLEEVLKLHFELEPQSRAARVSELLVQVGLDERHADAYPRMLSGGQRQRVALARALAVEPSVLILDEPVSALDVSIQAQVLNLLNDTRERTGIAFLFISHDLAVVRQVCDEVLVMHHGVVVERGPTDQVLAHPADDYTKHLLNSVPRPGWSLGAPARAHL